MDRLLPAGSATENPENWNSYWVECLADSGITGLANIEHSWLVPIEEITDPDTIRQYLTAEIGESLGDEYDPEYISKAEAQIIRFRERIQPILAEYISAELAEEASRILVEGH